jgi:biotin carboxylase
VKRVLLLATTTGYQTRAFGEAAERLGVELVFATDRCGVLDDPWRDRAVPIRFYNEPASVRAILSAGPFNGVLAVGDRPVVIASLVLDALGLPGHRPAAAAIARNKLMMRRSLAAAGLPTPSFREVPVESDPDRLAAETVFPVVVKPTGLSGSRGVIRADDPISLAAAFRRLQAILRSPQVRAERSDLHDTAIIESFIPGREYALEGLLHHGRLYPLAIFDKPDPLDGPFFEETLYLTPSVASRVDQDAIVAAVTAAAAAMGLEHGPIHAECRLNGEGVFVIEVAARPIGGLCARALRFTERTGGDVELPLEELLLRHALGEPPDRWSRVRDASGVLMLPISSPGLLRRVDGVEEARSVPDVTEVHITAKLGHPLVPLPEGATYLGFVFARAGTAAQAEAALRDAHSRLRFAIDPEVPVVQSRHG